MGGQVPTPPPPPALNAHGGAMNLPPPGKYIFTELHLLDLTLLLH